MQSTNVREIKAAIQNQAMSGRRNVRIAAGRVINVRTFKGQLEARTIAGVWHKVDYVMID